MAITISTGFQSCSSGSSRYIDLSAYSNVVSARVRFRDRQQVQNSNSNAVDSTIATDSPDYVQVYTPPVPSGWNFTRTDIIGTGYNKSSETIGFELWAGYDSTHKSINEVSALAPNGGLSTDYTVTGTFQEVSFALVDTTPAGIPVTIRCIAVTYYWRYLKARNPTTNINSVNTTYSGTLTVGQTTSWQTLTGLEAGKSNRVFYYVYDATAVDVEIEYTVSMAPTVQSQDAIDISYTAGTMKGVVTNEGGSTVECGFEYGATVSLGSSSIKLYHYSIFIIPCSTKP